MTLSFFTRNDRMENVKFNLSFQIAQFHRSETVTDLAGTKEDIVHGYSENRYDRT